MKIFSKLYVKFQRKLGKKYQNYPYCSSLQSVVVYNFTEIESTFPVPFWDYVADCLWLRDMVSICLMRKDKWTDSSTKDFSLIGLVFFYICCNLSVAQNILPRQKIFYSEVCSFISYIQLVLQHLGIFVTVMQSNFTTF